MKKFKYIFLVLFCLVFLSGCVKSHNTIGINKDKSMSYENEILFSKELGDDMTTLVDSEKYEKAGYKVTVVDEEKYSGIKISNKYSNIDDFSNNKGEEVTISNFLDDNFDKSVLFKKKSGFLKDTYTAKFKYSIDTTEYNNLEENTTSFETEEENTNDTTEEENVIDNTTEEGNLDNYINLMGEMEFTFKVNLPYKANSSNASEVNNDGKSLTWKLTMDTANDINFEFSIYNMAHIIMLGGGALAFIIIIVVLLLVLKKKKASKETLIHKDYDPSIEGLVNTDNTQVVNSTIVTNPVSNTETVAAQIESVSNQTNVTQPQEVQGPVVQSTNTVPEVPTSPTQVVEPTVVSVNNNQNVQ